MVPDVRMNRPKPSLFSKQLLAFATLLPQFAPLSASYHPILLQPAVQVFTSSI